MASAAPLVGKVRSRSAGPTSSSAKRLARNGPEKWRRRSAALSVTVLAPESCAAANALTRSVPSFSPASSTTITIFPPSAALMAASGTPVERRATARARARSRRRRRAPPSPGRAPPGSSPRARCGGSRPTARARAGCSGRRTPLRSPSAFQRTARRRRKRGGPAAPGARARPERVGEARAGPCKVVARSDGDRANPRRHESSASRLVVTLTRRVRDARAASSSRSASSRRPASTATPTRARTASESASPSEPTRAGHALGDPTFVTREGRSTARKTVELRPLGRIGMSRSMRVDALERRTGFAEAAGSDRGVHLAFGDVAQRAVRLPALGSTKLGPGEKAPARRSFRRGSEPRERKPTGPVRKLVGTERDQIDGEHGLAALVDRAKPLQEGELLGRRERVDDRHEVDVAASWTEALADERALRVNRHHTVLALESVDERRDDCVVVAPSEPGSRTSGRASAILQTARRTFTGPY